MVRNVMRGFDVPLKEHNWAQKWCVDVHNIASSKNLNGRFLLEMIENQPSTFQHLDFICGSLFGILRSIRLNKIFAN